MTTNRSIKPLEALPDDTPWNIQPGETITHYNAFQAYLHQDPPRSFTRLSEELGKHKNTLYHYSSAFMWTPRARAYDEWMAKRVFEDLAKEKMRLRREQLRALERARLISETQLVRLQENPELLLDMPFRDVMAYLTESVKLERLIVGEVTDRVEATERRDWSRLTDEELAQAEAWDRKCAVDDAED